MTRASRSGSVAGDAVFPQLGLSATVRRDRVGGAQPRIAVQQPAAEPLEPDGVVDRQAEVAQLDLAVGAGQRQRPRDRAAVVILLGQPMRLRLGVGEAGHEGEPRGAAGRQPQELAQATIGSSTGPVVFDSGSSVASATGLASVRPRPTKRARSVSYCVGGPTRPRPLNMCSR